MRKVNLLLLFIFSLFFGVFSVDAMILKPTGDNTGIRGKNVTIYISLNRDSSEKTISAVDGKFCCRYTLSWETLVSL